MRVDVRWIRSGNRRFEATDGARAALGGLEIGANFGSEAEGWWRGQSLYLRRSGVLRKAVAITVAGALAGTLQQDLLGTGGLLSPGSVKLILNLRNTRAALVLQGNTLLETAMTSFTQKDGQATWGVSPTLENDWWPALCWYQLISAHV